MSKPTFSFQVAEKAALSCATLQSQMTRWRRLLPTLAAQQRGMWFLVVASRCHPHCTSGSTSVGKVNKLQSRKDQPNWLVSRCKLTRRHVADTPGTRVTRARGRGTLHDVERPRSIHLNAWNGRTPRTLGFLPAGARQEGNGISRQTIRPKEEEGQEGEQGGGGALPIRHQGASSAAAACSLACSLVGCSRHSVGNHARSPRGGAYAAPYVSHRSLAHRQLISVLSSLSLHSYFRSFDSETMSLQRDAHRETPPSTFQSSL